MNQKKDLSQVKSRFAEAAGGTQGAVLGCGFKTENVVWDELGLPIPYQDITVYFTHNGSKVSTSYNEVTIIIYSYMDV